MPTINNLDTTIADAEARKERLLSLTYFGLFMWTRDEVILPNESSWFSIWDED